MFTLRNASTNYTVNPTTSGGVVEREFLLIFNELYIYVTLYGNCFASALTYTFIENLKRKERE